MEKPTRVSVHQFRPHSDKRKTAADYEPLRRKAIWLLRWRTFLYYLTWPFSKHK